MLQNKVTSPTCSKFSSSDANLRSNSESIYQTNNGFESILNRSISMPSSDSLVGSPAEQNVFHLTSQLSSMVQCSTALSNLPRFPHPLAIHDDEIGLSLASSRIHRATPTTRRTRHFVPNDCKDEYYWQKRRKNNEAARKSREKRRTIDSVLEKKVLLLAHENKVLKDEVRALKLKYGEIPMDPPLVGVKNENDLKITQPRRDQINREQVTGNLASYHDDSLTSSIGNTVFPHTAISLPKLNVILENDKSSTDPTSTAKLLLSNLASGTLILSPISVLTNSAISDSVAPCSSLHDESGPVRLNNGEELACVQDNLHASADLNDKVKVSAKNLLLKDDKIARSLSFEQSSECVDTKKVQLLPHKLRFKHSLRESID